MGSLKKYYFGKSKYKPNTFIGGIGGTINTPALIATKLGLSINRIKVFSVVGSDIQFAIIGGTYVLTGFLSDTNVTYYDDRDGLVTSIGGSAFNSTTNLQYVKVKNATTLGASAFQLSGLRGLNNDFTSVTSVASNCFVTGRPAITTVLNFPNLTTILANTAFSFDTTYANNVTINVPLALKTSNAGKPHTALSSGVNLTAVIINYIGWVDDTSYNTELGGVGTYYANKGLLAKAMGIGSGGLVNMQNVSGVLRVKALDTYPLASNGFQSNTSLTYFDDSIASLVTGFGTLSIVSVTNLVWVKFPGVITLNGFRNFSSCASLTTVELNNMVTHNGDWFGRTCPNLKIQHFPNCTRVTSNIALIDASFTLLNMPKCIQLGGSAADNGTLLNLATGCVINVNVALQTNNAGAPDGDLQYAITSRSATVNYIP